MSPVGFEPTISAGERPLTYALNGSATGTGTYLLYINKFQCGNGAISPNIARKTSTIK
jgi:hypothetical protein